MRGGGGLNKYFIGEHRDYLVDFVVVFFLPFPDDQCVLLSFFEKRIITVDCLHCVVCLCL